MKNKCEITNGHGDSNVSVIMKEQMWYKKWSWKLKGECDHEGTNVISIRWDFFLLARSHHCLCVLLWLSTECPGVQAGSHQVTCDRPRFLCATLFVKYGSRLLFPGPCTWARVVRKEGGGGGGWWGGGEESVDPCPSGGWTWSLLPRPGFLCKPSVSRWFAR